MCSKCGGTTPKPAEPVTVTVNFKTLKEAGKVANSTKYTSLDNLIDDSVVSIEATGGTNTGKYYDSGYEWRIYQNENPAVTISVKDGYELIYVMIKYNISNTGVLLDPSSNQFKSESTYTITKADEKQSVTFKVGNTGSATNGQVKITEMEIKYIKSGGTTNPTEHKCTSICDTCKGCTNADCNEKVCGTKCPGNHNGSGSETTGKTTVYTFGTTQYGDSNALTQALLSGCCTSGDNILSSATISTAFWTTGNNTLRLGSAKAGGTLTLVLTNKVTKVVINCVQYSSTAATLSVNNSGQSAPSSAGDLTFTLSSATTNITITSSIRLCICSITFYYGE